MKLKENQATLQVRWQKEKQEGHSKFHHFFHASNLFSLFKKSHNRDNLFSYAVLNRYKLVLRT